MKMSTQKNIAGFFLFGIPVLILQIKKYTFDTKL